MIFVEVLGRTGEVLHRIPVDHFPASLGRAYDNDIIIDDPYVAPHHVRLERHNEGNIVAHALPSKNGLFTLHPTRRVESVMLDRETRLRVGHTQLRVRSNAFEVPVDERDPLSGGWQSVGMFFVTLIAYLLAFGFLTFASSFEETTPSSALGGLPPALGYSLGLSIAGLPYALGVPGLWAGAWAIIGRLATGRAQFFAHGTLTLLAAISGTVIEPLLKAVSFAFSAPGIAGLVPYALAAIGAALLYRQLRFVSALPRRLLAGAALGFCSLILAASQVAEFMESRDDVQSLSSTDILTLPALRLTPGASVDEFIDGFAQIESRLSDDVRASSR